MTHRLGQTAKSDRTLCYFGGNPRKENPLLRQASSRIDEVRRSGRLAFTASSSEHEKKRAHRDGTVVSVSHGTSIRSVKVFSVGIRATVDVIERSLGVMNARSPCQAEAGVTEVQ
jgi:hypothetical protein